MVFMGCGFTSGGQESWSVFSAAVCKIQASKATLNSSHGPCTKQMIVIYIAIDGFPMLIKRPTSGGQMRDQEAAVQQTFHLERRSFGTNGKDSRSQGRFT